MKVYLLRYHQAPDPGYATLGVFSTIEKADQAKQNHIVAGYDENLLQVDEIGLDFDQALNEVI